MLTLIYQRKWLLCLKFEVHSSWLPQLSDCDECEGRFILGDCPEHGPLVWVDDCQETHPGPAKNVTNLPSDLCLKPSAVMQGHLGVFTKENIKKRVIFGPFKGQAIPFEELNVGDNFMRLWEVSCCSFHLFTFQEKRQSINSDAMYFSCSFPRK